MVRYRILFSGTGGQGIITAAIVLAEAAVLYDSLNAVQSQSYGSEARGGSSRSDVIISDEDILFPKVIQPNILVCLSQKAYNNFSGLIRPGGLLLTDKYYVKQEKKVDANQVQLDMYAAVIDQIGTKIVFNICMLGALINITKIVRKESIFKVLEKRSPIAFLNYNLKALELGQRLTKNYKPFRFF